MVTKSLENMTNEELITWAKELRAGANEAGRRGEDSKARDLRAEERKAVRELEQRGLINEVMR